MVQGGVGSSNNSHKDLRGDFVKHRGLATQSIKRKRPGGGGLGSDAVAKVKYVCICLRGGRGDMTPEQSVNAGGYRGKKYGNGSYGVKGAPKTAILNQAKANGKKSSLLIKKIGLDKNDEQSAHSEG